MHLESCRQVADAGDRQRLAASKLLSSRRNRVKVAEIPATHVNAFGHKHHDSKPAKTGPQPVDTSRIQGFNEAWTPNLIR